MERRSVSNVRVREGSDMGLELLGVREGSQEQGNGSADNA